MHQKSVSSAMWLFLCIDILIKYSNIQSFTVSHASTLTTVHICAAFYLTFSSAC